MQSSSTKYLFDDAALRCIKDICRDPARKNIYDRFCTLNSSAAQAIRKLLHNTFGITEFLNHMCASITNILQREGNEVRTALLNDVNKLKSLKKIESSREGASKRRIAKANDLIESPLPSSHDEPIKALLRSPQKNLVTDRHKRDVGLKPSSTDSRKVVERASKMLDKVKQQAEPQKESSISKGNQGEVSEQPNSQDDRTCNDCKKSQEFKDILSELQPIVKSYVEESLNVAWKEKIKDFICQELAASNSIRDISSITRQEFKDEADRAAQVGAETEEARKGWFSPFLSRFFTVPNQAK